MIRFFRYILLVFALLTGLNVMAGSTVKVGVMLPLHDVDGDGKRMVEYYRGVLLACEDLKQENIDIEVRAWNVPGDADIRPTLLSNGAKNCDIIIGPLYSAQVKPLAEFCANFKIKMLIPFSINSSEVMNNRYVYQVYQSQPELDQAAIKAFFNRFPDCHPVIIDCNNPKASRGDFTAAMRTELEKRHISYNLTNLVSPDEAFIKAFDNTKRNVVILNSVASRDLTAALDKLDLMTKVHPGKAISIFGYTPWFMYTKYNQERFSKYDTYIPSCYYYNANSKKTQELEQRYQQWFGAHTQWALPRFAITGYDHAQFFIRGIYLMGKSFTGEKGQSLYQPLQTPLRFARQQNGGLKNNAFLLIHYNYNHNIEEITY